MCIFSNLARQKLKRKSPMYISASLDDICAMSQEVSLNLLHISETNSKLKTTRTLKVLARVKSLKNLTWRWSLFCSLMTYVFLKNNSLSQNSRISNVLHLIYVETLCPELELEQTARVFSQAKISYSEPRSTLHEQDYPADKQQKSKNRRQERPLWLQEVREWMSKTTKIG